MTKRESPSDTLDATFPAFPKGDVRRLLALAVAIEDLERATLTTLSARTGRHKQVIQDDAAKLHELGIAVHKDGAVYSLESWGPILRHTQVRAFLRQATDGS